MPPSQPKKPDVSAAAKERNEYIPSFISKKPFYAVDETGEDQADYLEHQRLQKQEQDSKWYDRGQGWRILIFGEQIRWLLWQLRNCDQAR